MQPDFHLTPEEATLVGNGAWLITKQKIIGKVYGMFGLLSEQYSEILSLYSHYLPAEVASVSPKIYKGEMYRQLPYVMMDQPRIFSREDIFAIRTFFWWGNHFSIHLLLSGKYLNLFSDALSKNINTGRLDNWYLGTGDDPWEHHFEDDNYQQIHIARSHKFQALHHKGHLKIAVLHSLDEWNGTYPFFISAFKKILESVV